MSYVIVSNINEVLLTSTEECKHGKCLGKLEEKRPLERYRVLS